MTTVRVLVDHVGAFMAGDIITDAPAGLVHMAIVGTKNAATGERVAEIVEEQVEDSEELKGLRSFAKELKIPKCAKMTVNELVAAIDVVKAELTTEAGEIIAERMKAILGSVSDGE